MNWNIFLYILLGILAVALLVVAIIVFIRSGMKDYLIQLIGEAENLYPNTEPGYRNKRLEYVVSHFKEKYKWISWLLNAIKFISKFCANYVVKKK
jgi:hypothetical protein